MGFIAIDVETANPDYASICQIGLAKFHGGELNDSWQSLVNPEDYFDFINISIHGIDETMVKDSPKFYELYDFLKNSLSGKTVISHMPFDRVALKQVAKKYKLDEIDCLWLDSARVVRRAWPDKFAWKGYGLSNVAEQLGIKFRHHDALEDARAAGEIMLEAMTDTGLNLEQWKKRVKQPIMGLESISRAREGNPDGPLFGEVVVFTGALTIPRREAADMAAAAGCDVSSHLKKITTFLIVGNQDIRRLAGHKKSSKHRKTEEMISKGQKIKILTEDDFRELISIDDTI
jgi:DNA polymerase-3 subunit epsilon